MKILIVDDSPVMRSIVKNTLTHLGYPSDSWREAVDGDAAWTLLTQQTPDVVLLDWNMPNLDGYELLKRIRGDGRFAKVAVIMTTSESAKANVVAAVKAGATDYMIKPIREEQLGEKLMHVQNAILLSGL